MKKYLTIILLSLLLFCFPIISISSNALTNKSVDIAGYKDIVPTLVTASDDTIYALNTTDSFVYMLKNGSMQKTSLSGEISKMKYYLSNIYYTCENSLYKYNLQTSTSSLVVSVANNIVDFDITLTDIYLLTRTTVYSFSLTDNSVSTISSVFSNAKSLTYKEDCLYVIDINKLYSITQEFVVLLGTISQQSTSLYEVIALEDNLMVLEKPKNTINLYTYKGVFEANCLNATNDVVTRTFKSGEVFSIDSFCKQNNEIVVCDSTSKSIQTFTLNEKQLNFSKLIAASKGADTNRLNHAKDFDIISSDNFVFADTDNNRITVVNYQTNTSKELNSLFNVPRIIAVNNLEEIYVYDNNYLTKIASDNTKQEIALPFVVYDIVCDTLSNTYIFDATNNKVVKMVNNSFADIANIQKANNLQMCINASATTLYILHDNIISLIDLETNSENEINLSYVPVSIAVDYKNNIYLLKNIENGYELIKMSNGEIVTSKQIETTNSLIKINIDLHTGKLYALNDSLCCLTELDVAFTENLLSYSSNTSYFSVEPQKNEVEVYLVESECQAYKYPFNVSPLLTLDRGDKIIMLDYDIEDNEKFAYCLITGKENTNLAAFIQKSVIKKLTEQIIPEYENVRVITAIANVYKYPTTQPVSVNGENITCNLTSLQLKRDEIVSIKSYAYGLTDTNGTQFMCVTLSDGSVVYINKNTAINSDLDADKYNKVFQPNGKLVSQRNIEIEGYTLNEDGSYRKVTTFESGRLIYLENAFDTNKEYTKIVYLNSNNEQISIYVLTRFIDPDDITVPQIIGLIILLFVIISSVLLTVILVKNKKSKLN